jgi:ribonuclease D
MEIFHLVTHGKTIHNIVDTQIAAQFLNMNDCMGLGNLLSEVLNVEISKSETVSDWIHRPLNQKQLVYASEDVLYLHQLYKHLKITLQKENKFNFFLEECEVLNQTKNPIDSIFEKHVKSTDSLRFRAIFKDLLEWREKYAIRKNLPRNWILKEAQLNKIAKYENPPQWVQPEILSEKQFDSYSHDFIQIHQQHSALNNKKITITQQEAQIFEQLSGLIKARIHRYSQRIGIPAELFCNQRNLKAKTQKMISEQIFEGFSGWRGQLLNESLQQLFNQFMQNKNSHKIDVENECP